MGGVAKAIGTIAGTALGGPLLGAAVGGGLGAVSQNQKRGEFNRQKELAAKTAQYSPWTGLDATKYMPQSAPSALENIGGGLLGGGMQGWKWHEAANANPMTGAEQVGGDGSQMAGAFSAKPASFYDMVMKKSPWSIS